MSRRYTCEACVQVDFQDGTTLECEATLEATGTMDDYGVPQSPEWLSIEDVSVVYPVTIDGVEYADPAAVDAMAFPGFHVTLENQFLQHDWSDWTAEEPEWHEGDML